MKRQIFHAILATSVICAAHAMADPLGFNKIVCLTNSDTIVGVPFRMQGSPRDLMAGAPGAVEGNPDLAEITLQSVNLTPGSLDRHYLKFDGGPRDGRWYDITANTATSVTIDLNGDTLDGVGSGNPVTITEYWTLDTLFPPDQATTSWTENPENPGEMIQNGHAIVASPNAFTRRTELFVPNLTAEGINLAPSATYYITGGVWKKFGDNSKPDFGETILYPDNYFTIRHALSVAHHTIYRTHGEVMMDNFTVFLASRASGKQDNFIGIPRPVPVKLKDLGLNDDAVFAVSSSVFVRSDELFVFDNETAIRNRAPSATYYRLSNGWRKFGESAIDHDETTIQAGVGFFIRKSATTSGETAIWQNSLILSQE